LIGVELTVYKDFYTKISLYLFYERNAKEVKGSNPIEIKKMSSRQGIVQFQ